MCHKPFRNHKSSEISKSSREVKETHETSVTPLIIIDLFSSGGVLNKNRFI